MIKIKQQWALPDFRQAAKRTRSATERVDTFMIPACAMGLGENKKYAISTYGCQANERDSETLAGIMETMGFTQTQDLQEADVILINTCAIRENAMDKVLGEIGSLKRLARNKDDLIIAVCGCMSQEEGFVERLLEKYPHVRLLFGTHNIHQLPQMLYDAMMKGERVVQIFSREGEVYENQPVRRFGKHKAWVNIMYGCDKFCTYCIVPYTRGKQRSRTMENVLQEVEDLKAQGYKEITLLGQNVNAYGKDLEDGTSFAALLEAVAKTGIQRIRFTTSHPWDFSDEMIDIIARYDNIMPAIHLPVQSGDDEILKRMGRRYTSESYMELFGKLKAAIPQASFSTDIIVGFPQESDAAFQHTLDLVKACKFDNAFTFIFSPRPGTPAARMEDDIDMETKKQRLAALNEEWHKYALAKNRTYIGRDVEVLVDGLSKRNDQVYSGYTRDNKLVNFTGENLQEGDIVNVRITDAKTFSLDGKAL